jgi:molybdopterin-guanine dinucleotide biosynthesis protein A
MDDVAVTIAADHPPTLGVVLAGGAARRMGGDKALREIGGRTLLRRVIDALALQCSALVVSVHGDPGRFTETGWTILADDVAGRAGPLAGILRAMDHAALHGQQWLLSAPVDCPFLPADLAARLHRARGADEGCIALAASQGRTHPVIALWPVALRHALRQSLDVDDERRVGAFIARHPHVTAQWPAQPYDPFFNVNTPDDLREARSIAARHAL